MHTVKPLDEELLRDVLNRFAVVAVVEEHSRIGGLGSAVAEWAAAEESRVKARLLSFGTPDLFLPEIGLAEISPQAVSASRPKRLPTEIA